MEAEGAAGGREIQHERNPGTILETRLHSQSITVLTFLGQHSSSSVCRTPPAFYWCFSRTRIIFHLCVTINLSPVCEWMNNYLLTPWLGISEYQQCCSFRFFVKHCWSPFRLAGRYSCPRAAVDLLLSCQTVDEVRPAKNVQKEKSRNNCYIPGLKLSLSECKRE